MVYSVIAMYQLMKRAPLGSGKSSIYFLDP